MSAARRVYVCDRALWSEQKIKSFKGMDVGDERIKKWTIKNKY